MARVIGKPKSILTEHYQPPQPEVPNLPQGALHEPALPLKPGARPILILSGCRWNATGGGQRPVQLARAIKSLGYEVIYASMFDVPSMAPEGITVTNMRDLEAQMADLLKISSLVICGFPTAYQYCIGLRNWCRVLDLCDDWQAFKDAGLLPGSMWVPRYEDVACRDAHVTTYSAEALGEIARRRGAVYTVKVPNAGPAAPLPCDDPPADLLRGKITTVFCGCLWGDWLDWPAIAKLAQALKPKGGVVNIIGGMDNSNKAAEFPQAENIRYHGSKPYDEAMRYVAACDVGLIPFKGEAICEAVDPVKWYDYIASGIPVVATSVMCEIAGRPHTTLAAPDKLAGAVVKAAKAGRIDPQWVAEFCERESWIERARDFISCPDIKGIWF